MNNDHKGSFKNHISFFLKGNESAINFCVMIIDIIDTWDDLVDGDEVSQDDINNAFFLSLFELPKNQFYRQCESELRPVMINVFLRWNDANKMEAKGEHLEKCYMLRAGLYDLFAHCALLVGGLKWANEIGPSIRKLYGETLEDYLEEMKCQIQ